MRFGPQLQVLGTIVVAYTVAMMHRLSWFEIPAERLLSHEDVLEGVRRLPGPRVPWQANHHVAGFVPSPSTFPVAVRFDSFGAA